MIIFFGTLLTVITLCLIPKHCYKFNKNLVIPIVCGYIITLLCLITFQSNGNGDYLWIDLLIICSIISWMIWRFKTFYLLKDNYFEFEVYYRLIIIGMFWYYLMIRKLTFNFAIPNGTELVLVLSGTVILIAVETAINWKLKFFRLVRPQVEIKNMIIIITYMLVWVALFQEFLFRGLLIGLLASFSITPVVGLVLSSVIFGLAHLNYAGWKMVIVATVAGLAYGLVYQFTDNVIAAVLIHTGTNLFWKTFTKEYSKQ